MYCDLWLQYIQVRKLFKGGNYSKEETIDFFLFFSVILLSLEWANTHWFHVIQLKQIDFCCLRLVLTIILFWRLRVRKLFKGGNYLSLGGFDRGNYSKEESIQGRKLYEEIRYVWKGWEILSNMRSIHYGSTGCGVFKQGIQN